MTAPLNLSSIKAGDKIVHEGGFDCLTVGAPCLIFRDGKGLFINCGEGTHHLHRWADAAGDLRGFRKIEAEGGAS